MSSPDGLLVVDKEGGWTSHDVVAKVRRLAQTRKVGHAGTLDPMATGVLLLGIGRATRLLGHLALTDKTYEATIRLGVTTVTDDAEGDVLETRDASGVGDVSAQLAALTGDLDQVPSAVSAIKVDGKRAYARVRAGEDVVLASRRVTVSELALLDRRGDDLDVRVTCSSGTYIRAIARDLGAALGVGAHLTALRRTRVGPFGIDQARTLEQHAEELRVIALDGAVAAAFPRRDLDTQEAVDLSYGKKLAPSGAPGTTAAFDPQGQCVGLIEDRDGAARASVVFRPGTGPGPGPTA